jgi:N-terminal half of MaoC dehydratase
MGWTDQMAVPGGSMTSTADEIRADYLARYGTPRSEPVEAGRVLDYLLALNEPLQPEAMMPVPALFLLTLGRTRRPQPARGAAVNAGDDYEFLAPVFVEDVITITRRVLAIEEKQGKQGQMYLTRAEAIYTNQHGRVVARALLNTLRWGW